MTDFDPWGQLPADAREMNRLAERLVIRTGLEAPTPWVDRNGILRFRDQFVCLPPIEARLARALVDEPGSVVSRRLLLREWKDRAVGSGSLRTYMTRLRHRIAPLGLTVRSVSGRGYVIEATGES